jgi:hypothetical protein
MRLEPLVLLPLAAFVALASLFVIVIRRAGRLIAQTRELQAFRARVRDLDSRIGQSLEGASERIDAVRRQQLAATGIGDTLVAASDAVARYADEARALKGPVEAPMIGQDIAHELERAGRAIDMVEHGVTILESVRRGGRELEAQTSIKRGYLNLVHAREAISRHAARAAALQPRDAPNRAWQGLLPEVRDDPSDHTI